MATIVIGIVVLGSIAGMTVHLLKKPKADRGCGCGCSGCPHADQCHKN